MKNNVVIIGNGISGITAARFIRKFSDRPITVVSDESDHFYSRTALMYIYMGHLTYRQTKPYEDWFWEKNRIDLVRGYVRHVDTESRRLTLAGGNTMEYTDLIIATGSKSRKFGWPGQDLRGVQGLYNLQDLELLQTTSKGVERAVIVGGGLIGIELAEMLHSRNIHVILLVREQEYWANILPLDEGRMIGKHIREHHIDLRLSTELKEILPDENGRVRAVVTGDGETIPCTLVGLTTGVMPNVEFLEGSGIEIGHGVMVDDYFRTDAPGVYAIGDCAQFRTSKPGRPPIEQLWYTGRMHGETVARTICGEATPYERGVWFNSAKFFHIEYQTYGFVAPILPEGEQTLYWEHPSGKRAMRINYAADGGVVIGVNLFGIRHRQDVWERWLLDGRTVEYVLEHLGAANFDPEFYTQLEADVVKQYNEQNPGSPVSLKSRRGIKAKLRERVG